MTGAAPKWAVIGATLGVAACATNDGPVPTGALRSTIETVTVAVGPCFGFCPVYDLTLASDGTVRFLGRRHTAVLGARQRRVGLDLYREMATNLSRFRPAPGADGQVACDAAISDTSSYTVTWTGPDGRNAVVTLPSRCPGGPGKELDRILGELPQRLGISDWMQQTTRQGEPRG